MTRQSFPSIHPLDLFEELVTSHDHVSEPFWIKETYQGRFCEGRQNELKWKYAKEFILPGRSKGYFCPGFSVGIYSNNEYCIPHFFILDRYHAERIPLGLTGGETTRATFDVGTLLKILRDPRARDPENGYEFCYSRSYYGPAPEGRLKSIQVLIESDEMNDLSFGVSNIESNPFSITHSSDSHLEKRVFSCLREDDPLDYCKIVPGLYELALLGISKSRFFRPQPQQTVTTEVVDASIDLLFTGQERMSLQNQVAQARLALRDSWISVPRLNLGAKLLPSVRSGQDARDEFMTSAAPYLVEYLSALGVMRHEEAEELVTHKLTHYFLHNKGFQLNPKNARTIVQKVMELTSSSLALEAAE